MSSGKKQKAAAAAAAPPPAAAAAEVVVPEAAPATKPDFNGTYKLDRKENFEAYLNALGFGWISRLMVGHASPEMTIVQEGDKFTIAQTSIADKGTLSFSVGEDFEQTQHNGNVMKVSPKWDGEKLVLIMEPKEEGKGTSEKQTREVADQELTVTHVVGDVVARRIFKKTA